MNQAREMILCIPGPWPGRTELIQALVAAHNGRYMLAGPTLVDTVAKDHVTIDWEPHDPRMHAAFQCSNHDEATLTAIAAHQSVVYLHFPLDVPEQRERLLKYTDVLRKAGGIAVKLENSGLSHPWPRWFEWLSAPFENEHYLAFVLLAFDEAGGYSCGMHHFGLPDATIEEGSPEAFASLQAFNQYLLMEAPALKSGHTFRKDDESPRRRLRWTEDDRFEPDDLFHNPHGLWRLEAM